MNTALSEVQRALRDTARRYLSADFPAHRVADLANSKAGWDPASWPQLVRLGWLDPSIGFTDLAVLYEEAGAFLLPAPWFSTVTLGSPCLPPTDPARQAISEGGSIVTLALWRDLDHSVHRASPPFVVSDSGTVTGSLDDVMDLEWSSAVIVPAKRGPEVLLCLVDLLDFPGSIIPHRHGLDATRRRGRLILEAAPSRVLPDSASALAAIKVRALTALACEAVGVARAALTVGTEHAKTRLQFGKPIGTYQGVSHRLADVFKNLELSRSLAYRAAWSVETSESLTPTERALCTAAALLSTRTAVEACETAIQVLGAMGMTWDHPIHRWYKRALESRHAFGLQEDARSIGGQLLRKEISFTI